MFVLHFLHGQLFENQKILQSHDILLIQLPKRFYIHIKLLINYLFKFYIHFI